jgi:hypothetical protein
MSTLEKVIEVKQSYKWFVAPLIYPCYVLAFMLAVLSIFWGGFLLFSLALVPIGYGYYLQKKWEATSYIVTPNQIRYKKNIFWVDEGKVDFADIRMVTKKIVIPGLDVGSITLETAAQSGSNGDIIIENIDRVSELYRLFCTLESEAKNSSKKLSSNF